MTLWSLFRRSSPRRGRRGRPDTRKEHQNLLNPSDPCTNESTSSSSTHISAGISQNLVRDTYIHSVYLPSFPWRNFNNPDWSSDPLPHGHAVPTQTRTLAALCQR